MPREPCYWTRKLELDLVAFVQQREFIWKANGNTNHHIQQKYKAYAEFAALLGRGFTARSVRDRWVNIRSTFNHNLRRLEKSKETARTGAEIYVPSWPLWKPLQFLRGGRKEDGYESYSLPDFKTLSSNTVVKQELICNIDIEDLDLPETQSDKYDINDLSIRQRGQRTDRPRHRLKPVSKSNKSDKCKRIINDLVRAMDPLTSPNQDVQSYWFLGKHVTERLNSMRTGDAECACHDIMKFLDEIGSENT